MKRRGNDHIFLTWNTGGMFVKFLLPSFTVIFTKRKYFSESKWACSKLFEDAHFERFEMFDGVLNTPLQDQPPHILGNCSEIKSPGIFHFFAHALDIWDLTVLQVYSICVRNKIYKQKMSYFQRCSMRYFHMKFFLNEHFRFWDTYIPWLGWCTILCTINYLVCIRFLLPASTTFFVKSFQNIL